MATRSRIGIEGKNGITSIYCHWDGYPDNNGRILVEHYTDEDKIMQLMKLGNLSILGSELGEKRPFDNPYKYGTDEYETWQEKYKGQCLAYGRDRGEKNITARKHIDFDAFMDYREEYNYLFRNGKWECYDDERNPVDLQKQVDAA